MKATHERSRKEALSQVQHKKEGAEMLFCSTKSHLREGTASSMALGQGKKVPYGQNIDSDNQNVIYQVTTLSVQRDKSTHEDTENTTWQHFGIIFLRSKQTLSQARQGFPVGFDEI